MEQSEENMKVKGPGSIYFLLPSNFYNVNVCQALGFAFILFFLWIKKSSNTIYFILFFLGSKEEIKYYILLKQNYV